jgi:two-component system cell cycle response regulator
MLPSAMIETARRVLLIESTQSDRYLLRNWLASDRIEVYEAADIINGLAACTRFLPKLILLQLRLPTWDGFEAIRRIKNDPQTRSIPVIFIADSATTSEKAKGIDLGAVDFISKPFDPVELLARIHSALRTRAYLDLLEHRAHIDGLTELGNRFALQDHLPLAWETCRRKESGLAVLVTDLDRFKRVNDEHGHAAGDEVLRQAALSLRTSVRPGDFVARFGGEEFVIVAHDLDLKGAIAVAQRFRSSLAERKIALRSTTIQVTSSVGVSLVLDPGTEEPAVAINRADQALYKAKAAGRNAVWVWDRAASAPVAAETVASLGK